MQCVYSLLELINVTQTCRFDALWCIEVVTANSFLSSYLSIYTVAEEFVFHVPEAPTFVATHAHTAKYRLSEYKQSDWQN